MKKNYNDKKLNKKQRHLKKWIPDSIYCDNCPFWFNVTDKVKHKRELCDFKYNCTDNCDNCDEFISYCSFLNYIEYGQYPLGDGCKVCDIKDGGTLKAKREYINILRCSMLPPMNEFIDRTYINPKVIKKK